MKSLCITIPLALLLWTPTAFAEYCKVSPEDEKTSCIYKVNRIPRNTQIVINYTQQGWSMMIVVFRDEFAIIEGDARVETKDGGEYTLKYVSTRRDMVSGKMMEAALYMVDEALLQGLSKAGGKVRFFLAADEVKKGVEVEVAASQFDEIDAYIAETRAVLAELFENR